MNSLHSLGTISPIKVDDPAPICCLRLFNKQQIYLLRFRFSRLSCMLLIGLFVVACVSRVAPDPALTEAIRWYTGEAGVVDDVRARKLLERAAADEDALSVMWLARVYSTGRMTYPADKAQAIELASTVINAVEKLALAGVGEANFLMGTAYAEGLSVEVDPAAAVTWYRRAAALDITLAQHNLGNVYAAGSGVPQSDSEAVRWWRIAAEKGDAITQYRLAQMYELGKGVEQNLTQALTWYEESARRGNQNAAAALERLQNN